MKKYRLNWYKLNPWYKSFDSAKQRCKNPNDKKYHRYGARGIKFLLTISEIKEIWFRDKAVEMKCPSIDRINNDGNYEYNNCQFIERADNARKGNIIIDEFINYESKNKRHYLRKKSKGLCLHCKNKSSSSMFCLIHLEKHRLKSSEHRKSISQIVAS